MWDEFRPLSLLSAAVLCTTPKKIRACHSSWSQPNKVVGASQGGFNSRAPPPTSHPREKIPPACRSPPPRRIRQQRPPRRRGHHGELVGTPPSSCRRGGPTDPARAPCAWPA